jgi:hypothetical protein
LRSTGQNPMLVGTVHEYSVLRTQAGTERRGSRLSGQMRTGGVARLSQRLISHDELHADGRSEGPGTVGQARWRHHRCHAHESASQDLFASRRPKVGSRPPPEIAGGRARAEHRTLAPFPDHSVSPKFSPTFTSPHPLRAPGSPHLGGSPTHTQHFPCRDLARLGHEGGPRKEDRTGFAWVCWSAHDKRAA